MTFESYLSSVNALVADAESHGHQIERSENSVSVSNGDVWFEFFVLREMVADEDLPKLDYFILEVRQILSLT